MGTNPKTGGVMLLLGLAAFGAAYAAPASQRNGWLCAAVGLLIGALVIGLWLWPFERLSGEWKALRQRLSDFTNPLTDAFHGMNQGLDATWEGEVCAIGWPLDVNPWNELPTTWASRNYERLDLRERRIYDLARRIYRPNPHDSILGSKFDDFDKVRRSLKDFYDEWGNYWWRGAAYWFYGRFTKVPKYKGYVVMLAYLELALAEAKPQATDGRPGYEGLWLLERVWPNHRYTRDL